MTPLEVLIAARELISAPERWTTGWYARDANHETTHSHSPDAVRWCAAGALIRSGGNAAVFDLVNAVVITKMLGGHMAAVNDHFGHAAVLRMFDLAIETERAKVAT